LCPSWSAAACSHSARACGRPHSLTDASHCGCDSFLLIPYTEELPAWQALTGGALIIVLGDSLATAALFALAARALRYYQSQYIDRTSAMARGAPPSRTGLI
jgi:hypothetical protein